MQLSVIIVNYNVKFFLEHCLCSVLKAADQLAAEIFVVDNHSTDGSKSFFEEKYTTVKFIWNDRNVGFAKANNIAIALAKGKYILFLNPDTIVPEDCFVKCVSFLEAQPGVGALGVHMIDGSGKFLKESKRSFPSPVTSLYKLTGLTRLFPASRQFGEYHLGYLRENENNEVDVLAGAFIMAPTQVIVGLGGFDEQFFMYGEDIDLSFRIQKAGYKNFYFSESTIVHFKGESTKKGSINYVRMFYKAMSIFVNKHYAGGKAGTFNFLMQCAIWVRAFISAAGRFVKWIGMPVMDAVTILLSFWLTKILWNRYIKQEVTYSSALLVTAFIVFTFIFLAASYFSGLYDGGYKQSKLNRSAVAAVVVLLAGYSLLPESLRFSRGILVFGSLTAYLIISAMRSVLVKSRLIESKKDELNRYTIIAGTVSEYNAVCAFIRSAGLGERILGRVEVVVEKSPVAIGNIDELQKLFTIYPVKEIVFCHGELSFKRIIELLQTIPPSLKVKFFTAGCKSIIGSESKNIAGNYLTNQTDFRLNHQVAKRNKHLADLTVSIIFIITFPVHLLSQKKPSKFFRNVYDVLARKKTWVGYASRATDLPALKKGILTVTGTPNFMNTMLEENLLLADRWYAKNYSFWHDIKLLWKSYRFLSL